MTERQELHCHACNRYVQFDLDLGLEGNHILHCPNCGHEHCRVVRNGQITDERWDQRNGAYTPVYQVSTATITCSSTSTWDTYTSTGTGTMTTGSATFFLYDSWMNGSTS